MNGAGGRWDKCEWGHVADEAKEHGFHLALVLSYGNGAVRLNLKGIGSTEEDTHGRGGAGKWEGGLNIPSATLTR